MTGCPICLGKGLILFKRKDGSIVANAWLNCTCKREEPEHYREIDPSDFDFPRSWDFHRFVSERYGTGDPGPDKPPPEPPPSKPLPPRTQIIYRYKTEEHPTPDRAAAAKRVGDHREPTGYKGLTIESSEEG